MIYVLQVNNGTEQNVVSAVAKLNIYACAPTHDLIERKSGIWHTVRRHIFPGYIFVRSEGISCEDYYNIRNISGVIRFLGRPPTPLPMAEEVKLRWVLEAGNLAVSKGYIKDNKVTITDGILVGRENEIIKYSKRRKRCTLCCIINGKRHHFDVCAELDKI